MIKKYVVYAVLGWLGSVLPLLSLSIFDLPQYGDVLISELEIVVALSLFPPYVLVGSIGGLLAGHFRQTRKAAFIGGVLSFLIVAVGLFIYFGYF